MSYIKTRNGNKLYIKDWGSGRPVVLTHAWPLSADMWDETAIALANAGFRAIAYDRLGFGRSSQPFDGYDYDSLTDDLADVIKETSAKDATIIGFSMGGGEIARYMSRHEGKNVIKAALVGSVVPFLLKTPDHPEGVDQSVFDGIAAGIKADRAKFWADFFPNCFGPRASEAMCRWGEKQAMEVSLRATLECATSFSTTDFRPDLKAMAVPLLIIHGMQDKIVPIDLTSRAVHKAVPDSKLIEYPEGGHGLFASPEKEQLTKDILAFVKS